MRALVPALVVAALAAGCGARRLPPALAPRQVAPPLEPGRPEAGVGRVVLDVEGHRAEVVALDDGHPRPAEPRRLCITPCWTDLSPGRYALRFTSLDDPERTGVGYVRISEGTSVYRHRLGIRRRRGLRRFFGITLVAIGGVIDVTALGAAIDGSAPDEAIAGTAVVGIAVTSLAAWLIWTSGSVDQAGHGVQWPLPDVAGR